MRETIVLLTEARKLISDMVWSLPFESEENGGGYYFEGPGDWLDKAREWLEEIKKVEN